MTSIFVRFLLVLLLALPAADRPALGQAAPADGRGDIRSTKHNLLGVAEGVDSRQICVFCHTPSISDVQDVEPSGSANPAARPRWQQGLPAADGGFEYGIYDDIGGGKGVGSQSVACLSCHDFSQALGIGGNSLDHPFGIPYRGATEFPPLAEAAETPGGALSRRATRPLVAEADFRPARQAVINNRDVWWVPTSESGVARTRQDIPLYVRERPDADQNVIPFLECSSCHDPHSSSPLFLRVSNEGSRLCLSCHEK